MAEYGIPYMGSKSKIANEIIKIFPNAENFYDVFGGGFSITHAMLSRRKSHYNKFHFNEIRPGICDLIKQAINGDFNYNKFKPPWISREEFFAKLETDPMIKILWSFGNNGHNYIFSKEIEPYKKSMHMAIVFNEFDDLAKEILGLDGFKDGYSVTQKRLFLRNKIEYYRLSGIPQALLPFLNKSQKKQIAEKGIFDYTGFFRLEQLERLQQLEQLQRLQQLQQLQQLERLQQLEFYNLSYEQVPIKENSVIYCDPPYAGTADYGGQFNTKKFLDWANDQKNPVFISEYNISDERFKLVWASKKRSMLSSNKEKCVYKIEKMYANKSAQMALK